MSSSYSPIYAAQPDFPSFSSRQSAHEREPPHLSHAFGAARRCKSPIASPDIQDPIGSDRDVDDARDRRPTTAVSPLSPHPSFSLLFSLSLPLFSLFLFRHPRQQLLAYAPRAHRIIPFLRVPEISSLCRVLENPDP